MINPSAFERDEQRRVEQDAKTALDKSIGIRDADGNQLHGHERTERARDLREEMKRAAHNPPAESKAPPQVAPIEDVRMVVNAPNTAVCRGKEIALTIRYPPGAANDAAEVALSYYPFRVVMRRNPIDPTLFDRIVLPIGKIITEIAPIITQVVSGLAADIYPDPADAAWKTLDTVDTIWIQTDYTAGVAGGYAIKSFGAGDTWPNFDPGSGADQYYVEWTGTGAAGDQYIQVISRAVVATAMDRGDGTPLLVQKITTDLQLITLDTNGAAMQWLVPATGVQG